jgi:hypothetical protein
MADEVEEEVFATDAALETLPVLFVEAFGEAYRQEGKYAVAFETERGLIDQYGLDYEAPLPSELVLLSNGRKVGLWKNKLKARKKMMSTRESRRRQQQQQQQPVPPEPPEQLAPAVAAEGEGPKRNPKRRKQQLIATNNNN